MNIVNLHHHHHHEMWNFSLSPQTCWVWTIFFSPLVSICNKMIRNLGNKSTKKRENSLNCANVSIFFFIYNHHRHTFSDILSQIKEIFFSFQPLLCHHKSSREMCRLLWCCQTYTPEWWMSDFFSEILFKRVKWEWVEMWKKIFKWNLWKETLIWMICVISEGSERVEWRYDIQEEKLFCSNIFILSRLFFS